MDQLSRLLLSKEVTESQVQDRAQMVIDKLGQGQVQQALKNNNPWATLKAIASKPGRMFRLVTEEEQQAHIAQRAKTKHGAKVNNPKQKKQASMSKMMNMQLDPSLFRLDLKMLMGNLSHNFSLTKLKVTRVALPCAPQ